MKHCHRALALVLAAVLLGGTASAAGKNVPTYTERAVVQVMNNSYPAGVQADLPKALVRGARVMSGDQDGAMNWDRGLTRAEAAVMLLRLMDLEAEAQAQKAAPSPFSDVPEWANGYVNLAYEKGLVKGVGDSRFDPAGACGAKEFLVMLFRLTHLTEGKDYTWATAVEDLAAAAQRVDSDRETYRYYPGYSYGFAGQSLKDYLSHGGLFTREAAAGALYLMLSIDAGPDHQSLGDILAEEYGLSSLLLYDCAVRRTAGALAEQTVLSISGYTGKEPTVFTLKDGKLWVDDPAGTVFQTGETAEVGWVYLSNDKPLTLPHEDHTVTLLYHEFIGTSEDEEGNQVPSYAGYDLGLPILYRDGTWTFGPRSHRADPDYAYLHAYRDEAHWVRVMESEYPAHVLDSYITDDIRTLAASLTAGKTSDYDKAEAICRWVSTHIFYDEGSSGGKRSSQSAAQVLSSRKAVCDGYARLTRELMRCAGLECYAESSRAANHAWNVALLDGRWVVMDNTWDSELQYRDGVYLHPDAEYGETRAVSNYLEPDGAWMRRNFDADLDSFYGTHWLDQEPLVS